MEEKVGKKHTLSLCDREKLTIMGVKEVFSFDEELIALETSRGNLEIRGEGLHIIKMNMDDGEVIVEGMVSELSYQDSVGFGKKKGGFVSKLFK